MGPIFPPVKGAWRNGPQKGDPFWGAAWNRSWISGGTKGVNKKRGRARLRGTLNPREYISGRGRGRKWGDPFWERWESFEENSMYPWDPGSRTQAGGPGRVGLAYLPRPLTPYPLPRVRVLTQNP